MIELGFILLVIGFVVVIDVRREKDILKTIELTKDELMRIVDKDYKTNNERLIEMRSKLDQLESNLINTAGHNQQLASELKQLEESLISTATSMRELLKVRSDELVALTEDKIRGKSDHNAVQITALSRRLNDVEVALKRRKERSKK